MSFPLNAQQIACLDRHLHVAVTANAGSGKTAVLVERYLRIAVEDKVPVENIVAITFTKRAAAEMRERIHQKVSELIVKPAPWVIESANNDPTEAVERLQRLLRSMGKVRISTFHSFCAGLVRQYADVVGHPHTVRDLDELESQTLQSTALSNVLKRSLSHDNPLHPAILTLVENVSLDTTRVIMRSILRDHARAERACRFLALSEDDHLAHVHAVVAELQFDTLLQLLQMLIDMLAPYSLYDCYQTISSALQNAFVELRDKGLSRDTRSMAVETIDAYFTKKLEVRKKAVDKALLQEEIIPSPPSGIVGLYEFVQQEMDVVAEKEHREIVQTILQLGLDASHEYQSLKRERGAIDFSDMISDALHLLRNDEIAAQIRSSISHIMIDEFQDTDPTQFEIMELLAPDLAGGPRKGPFVFVVGDDKQSIYQFRNADVRLFRKARAAISRANLLNGNDDGLRQLTMSYRMHPDLCNAINSACAAIFSTSEQLSDRSYHVAYEALVAGSSASSDPTVERFRILEIPEADTQREGEDEDSSADEYGYVAAEVVRMLQRTDRGMRPMDIAVLVSKNAQKALVAEALRLNGVPCTVYGGRSFFSRPEIADIRNALTSCTHRQDDLSTAAVMRSPLLQCSDVDILVAAVSGKYSSIQDGLSRLVDAGTATDTQRNAHVFFETFSKQVCSMPVHRVIEEMIEFSSWYSAVSGDDRYLQMKQNVHKLISMCRDLEHAGGTTIGDILAAIAVPSDDSESEAPVLSSDDAVHVMTIHLSKGLEFEAVVLAGLNTGTRTASFQESTELGCTLALSKNIRSTTDPLVLISRSLPLSHAANSRIAERRRQAEANRLAYVALTRAKEELLIALPTTRHTDKLQGLAPVFHAAANACPHTYVVAGLAPSENRYTPGTLQGAEILNATAHLTPLPPSIRTPSEMVAEWSGAVRSDDVPSGSLIGTAVHSAIAETLPTLAENTDEQNMSRIVASLTRSGLSSDIIGAIATEIFLTLQSPLVQDNVHRLPHARIEQQLVAVDDDTLIYGTIDVRFAAENGVVELWDWKTSAIRSRKDIEELCEHYAPQLKAYAELCFAADPACHTVVARLIFTKAFDKGLAPDQAMMFTRPMR